MGRIKNILNTLGRGMGLGNGGMSNILTPYGKKRIGAMPKKMPKPESTIDTINKIQKRDRAMQKAFKR